MGKHVTENLLSKKIYLILNHLFADHEWQINFIVLFSHMYSYFVVVYKLHSDSSKTYHSSWICTNMELVQELPINSLFTCLHPTDVLLWAVIWERGVEGGKSERWEPTSRDPRKRSQDTTHGYLSTHSAFSSERACCWVRLKNQSPDVNFFPSKGIYS